MICPRCRSRNSEEALFCRQCGTLLATTDAVECDAHSGVRATGICVVCGRPVCKDCSVSRGEKTYCENATHASLETHHRKLGAAESDYAADLIVRNLTDNNISALAFSRIRFSQFCRLTDDLSTDIYVPVEKADVARILLEEMELADFLIDHTSSL